MILFFNEQLITVKTVIIHSGSPIIQSDLTSISQLHLFIQSVNASKYLIKFKKILTTTNIPIIMQAKT